MLGRTILFVAVGGVLPVMATCAPQTQSTSSACRPSSDSLRTVPELPSVRSALGRRDFPDAQVLLADTPPLMVNRRVVAVSWGGPDAGAILLFRCDGTLLWRKETEYIDSLRFQAVGATLPSVLIAYEHSAGATGYQSSDVSLYKLTDAGAEQLWTGTMTEESVSPSDSGFQEKATIQIDSSGAIHRRAVRTEIRAGRPRHTSNSEQQFRWDPGLGKFTIVG